MIVVCIIADPNNCHGYIERRYFTHSACEDARLEVLTARAELEKKGMRIEAYCGFRG